MSEEIDDLSSTLREFKDENEEEVTFLRSKVVSNLDYVFELYATENHTEHFSDDNNNNIPNFKHHINFKSLSFSSTDSGLSST